MKPLNSYDKKGILAEEVFVEIFEQEDAIRRAQMLLSFQDRAKELGAGLSRYLISSLLVITRAFCALATPSLTARAPAFSSTSIT